MAENGNGGNEHVKRAWRDFMAAFQALSDVIDENREEFYRLLNAAMALKMALEIEKILEADDGGEGIEAE